MNEPSRIRGRWKLVPNSHPFVSATLEGPRVTEPVEVVPVPDEQAIERAAKALCNASRDKHDPENCPALPVYRNMARAVLAAALESE